MPGLVPLAAKRHRGEIRRVGLHQQTLGRNVARDLAQFIGSREGQDPRETDIPAHRDRRLRQGARGTEAMQQKGEIAAVVAFFPQDQGDIGVGVAGVDGQRQPGQARATDMGAEVFPLHLARRTVVEVIQSGLADPDHLRMPGERRQRFRCGNRRFRGVVRMHPDGAPEMFVRLGQCRKSLRLRQSGADGDHLAHPGGGSARQHLRQLHRGVVVEMAVGIDQHQGTTRSFPGSAETPPAAPAG